MFFVSQRVSTNGTISGGEARGRLPRMIEVDDDDIQWAEAAEPPSDSDTGDNGSSVEGSGEDDGRFSPYSAIHLDSPHPHHQSRRAQQPQPQGH